MKKNIKNKKKVICFDLDNVICKTENNNYSQSQPIKKNISKINKIYNRGYCVKIFTARFMGRSKENAIIASKRGYNFTKKQLKKWKVKYDLLIFGKPSYDLFIDDKNYNFNKNWSKKILQDLKKLNK
jgi:hypothetical protein